MTKVQVARPERMPTVSPPQPLLVNRREAARLLGMSERGLRNRELAGDFVALRFGSAVRFSVEYLQNRIRELATCQPSAN